MTCEAFFIARLRELGFRLTPQREMVLSAMHELEGYRTADEIHDCVRQTSSAVDISTVYRTLDLLDEMGLVAMVDPADGQRLYKLEGVHAPHIHLVCQRCGAIAGVEPEPADPLAAQLLAQHGFEVDLERLSIPGLCRECRRAAGGAGAR